MVVSLNTAISKGYSANLANSDIAFGNSQKNTVKLAPQMGDELVLKGAKQAAHKNPLRNLARALMLTFGMGLAGTAITGCTPDDVPTPPVNPKDTTVVVDKDANLSALDKTFKKTMASVFAVDTTQAGAIDSLLVNDDYDGWVFGFKADVAKSSKDTLVFNRNVSTPSGTFITNFVSKFCVDQTDGRLLDYQYSKNGKLNTIRKYRKISDGVIEQLKDEDCFQYMPTKVGEAMKYSVANLENGAAIKLLHQTMRK